MVLTESDQIENMVLSHLSKSVKRVWKYKGMWEDFSNTVGFWADMDVSVCYFITTHLLSLSGGHWKKIWDKGLFIKDLRSPYCPRCGTPLSAQEVAQGYKDVKERSAIVRFKVKDEDVYILHGQ